MRPFLRLALSVASLATTAAALRAQDDTGLFKPPVFVVMPSVITLGAISRPEGAVPDESQSAFNVRFQTVLPTSSPWFTGVAGVQFMPNGPGSPKRNPPIVFYGLIIPVIQPKHTGGWFSLTFDPLGVYFLNPRTSEYPYSHELVLEGAAVLNIGAKMMRNMGAFQNLGAFFLLDQRVTHPTIDANGDEDRFDPVLVYGLALPLAPWRK